MALLGIDLGGTKLSLGVFSEEGEILLKKSIPIEERKGKDVGDLISSSFLELCEKGGYDIHSIGMSIPGIYRSKTGTVWAPNIPGWEDYPLLQEFEKVAEGKKVTIDSDRACCILGEVWQGNAKGCKDAIFLTVGTGIGAGILINGDVFRGANDIAGAIGWMSLQKPFEEKYIPFGCFEYSASGDGIARLAKEFILKNKKYNGELKKISTDKLSAYLIFEAFHKGDVLAKKVLENCIESWGMASANLVSLFNPEKIIFGGGVFGPARPFIPQIKKEAAKWAQPISMKLVAFEAAALKSDAALYGAAYLALKNSTA